VTPKGSAAPDIRIKQLNHAQGTRPDRVEFGFRYKISGARDALSCDHGGGSFQSQACSAVTPRCRSAGSYSQLTTTGKEDFLTWTFQMKTDLCRASGRLKSGPRGKKLRTAFRGHPAPNIVEARRNVMPARTPIVAFPVTAACR